MLPAHVVEALSRERWYQSFARKRPDEAPFRVDDDVRDRWIAEMRGAVHEADGVFFIQRMREVSSIGERLSARALVEIIE